MSVVEVNLRDRAGKGSFHTALRAATRTLHDDVDSLFGRFDLADPDSYAAFLTAHAKAVVPVEDWADIGRLMPGWSGRKVAIYEDLAALGRPMPRFESLDWPRDLAGRWGAAYVLEGSRLGGLMLSRRVGDGLPRAYLSAAHASGGWQRYLEALERQAEQGGEKFQKAAIAAAERSFALYARAGRAMLGA